jgi:hypothetical protein
VVPVAEGSNPFTHPSISLMARKMEIAPCISSGIENSGLVILRRKEVYDE